MSSHYWIQAPLRADRDQLRAGLALPPLLAAVSAHHHLRGPYTAVGTLLRLIGPEALRRNPDLAQRHRIELQETTPELAGLVPAILRPLEASAKGPVAVSRYPARLHSLRVSHGLVDFLESYLGGLGDTPRTLVVNDVEHADATDQEFLAVLLRRMPARLLTVVVTTGPDTPPERPGPTSESLPQALLAHTQRITAPDLPPAPAEDRPAEPQAAADELALAYVESDGVTDDPATVAAYEALDPARRAALHDARAAALATAAESEPSLRLGSLPYHLERGSTRNTAGVEALRWAQTRCKYLGLYGTAVEYGRRGLLLVDAEQQPDFWWEFTRDTAVSLAAAGRADESAVLQDAARRTSIDPAVHMKLAYETGMLYARHFAPEKRDPDQARAWINQAIAIASVLEDPQERTFFSVFNRNGLALVATRTGGMDEALRLLDEGIERLDKELGLGERSWHRVGLRYNRAQVNAMSGRLEDALADYAVVMDIDDDFSDHYFNRGNILRRMGRTEEALADYEHALTLEPPFPEAHYNCGDARLELGDIEGALAEFDRTLVLDPGNVDALLNRAGVHAELGDPQSALRDVAAGLELDPGNAPLLSLKGRLLAEQGEAGPALDALGAALESDPDLAEAWAVKAEIAFGAGDLETAVADFDRAIALGGSTAIRYNRGLVHEAAGRFAEAASDFAAVLAETDDEDAAVHHASCLRAERAGV
ncbi:tetratricopeptide repeat protein [Peterkaempfera bronchialis]|uniref:Tetratricopeptide repeat protein n=1 Tax=Peterkaempfera bronchialis TaxID=2126346 RepID=A0A345SXK5_9ACTN|nr:tetratricopeptide repeat protein [Peterkaempfera bronchialis]AXI78460.1 tetratricopeptide repeat protein [Peterkaempfera bronchialis]